MNETFEKFYQYDRINNHEKRAIMITENAPKVIGSRARVLEIFDDKAPAYAPVQWSEGRMIPYNINDHSSATVDMIDVGSKKSGYDYDATVVTFDPNDRKLNEGTIIRFHDGTDMRGFGPSRDLSKVHEPSLAQLCAMSGGKLVWGATALLSLFFGSHFFNDIMSDVGIIGFVLVQAFVTFVTVFFAAIIGTAFYKPFKPLTARQIKKRKTVGTNDELYFVEKGSIIPSLLRDNTNGFVSDDPLAFAALVKRKLQLGHDAAEVDAWSESVQNLLDVQETFPIERIPMMTEDVIIVQERLVTRLAELSKIAETDARLELEANTHGRATKIDFDKDESRATREGAVSWIDGMTMIEVEKK